MLRFAKLASEPRSVEQILREWLEAPDEGAPSSMELGPAAQRYRELEDQLSLLARWFYSKPRLGEIYFREGPRSSAGGVPDAASARRNTVWPYRRILRACSRLLAPPEEKKVESS